MPQGPSRSSVVEYLVGHRTQILQRIPAAAVVVTAAAATTSRHHGRPQSHGLTGTVSTLHRYALAGLLRAGPMPRGGYTSQPNGITQQYTDKQHCKVLRAELVPGRHLPGSSVAVSGRRGSLSYHWVISTRELLVLLCLCHRQGMPHCSCRCHRAYVHVRARHLQYERCRRLCCHGGCRAVDGRRTLFDRSDICHGFGSSQAVCWW